MTIKDPIWVLLIVAILVILWYYDYMPLGIIVLSFVIYVFIIGLWLELEEIKFMENFRIMLNSKIENIEKYISFTLQKIDSEQRIRDRLDKNKKEIIDWLNKF